MKLFRYKYFALFCFISSLSLLKVQAQKGNVTDVYYLNELAFELRNSNPDSALQIVNKAILLADASGELEQQALSYSRKGVVLQRLGRYDEALKALEKSIQYYQKANDNSEIGQVYCNMGIVHKKKGDFDLALKAYLMGLEMLTDQTSKAVMYNNIANIYSLQENYEKAVSYYQEAVELSEKQNDSIGMSRAYQNLGILYSELDSLKIAKTYFKKSLVIEQSIGSEKGLANLNSQLGYIEELQENYTSAERYYLDGLRLQRKLDQKEEVAYGLNSLGVVNLLLSRYRKAEKYFIKGLKLSEELGTKDLSREINYNLSQLHENRGDFKRSLAYFHVYSALNDSIYNETKSRQIAELTTKYETERKEKDIVILTRQNELNSVKIEKQKGDLVNQKLLLAIALLLIAVVSILAVSYRQKLNVQKIISSQERKLSHQKSTEILKSQEIHYLNSMMTLQEKERKRIASDLHDRLGNFLATVKLYFDTLQSRVSTLTDEEQYQFEKASQLLTKACDETRKIAHDMSSGAITQFGLIKAIEDIASIINSSKSIKIDVNAFDLDSKLDQKMEIQVFKIIQELLSNILKHAQATKATIQVIRHEDLLNIIVEDNGVGFNRPIESKGMGLNSIEKRVADMNGEFLVDSTPGSGTTMIINIPMMT